MARELGTWCRTDDRARVLGVHEDAGAVAAADDQVLVAVHVDVEGRHVVGPREVGHREAHGPLPTRVRTGLLGFLAEGDVAAHRPAQVVVDVEPAVAAPDVHVDVRDEDVVPLVAVQVRDEGLAAEAVIAVPAPEGNVKVKAVGLKITLPRPSFPVLSR